MNKIRDIQSLSNLCSEYMYRLTNGFENMADISEQISDNYQNRLVSEAAAICLKIQIDADDIGCFGTSQFYLTTNEKEKTNLDERICNLIQNSQELTKDLECLREMVNTSLQIIDTALSMTKEIETIAKTERKHLKEKDKK